MFSVVPRYLRRSTYHTGRRRTRTGLRVRRRAETEATGAESFATKRPKTFDVRSETETGTLGHVPLCVSSWTLLDRSVGCTTSLSSCSTTSSGLPRSWHPRRLLGPTRPTPGVPKREPEWVSDTIKRALGTGYCPCPPCPLLLIVVSLVLRGTTFRPSPSPRTGDWTH